jgi:MFS family permease
LWHAFWSASEASNSLSISLSILANAFGCLLWATYSSFCKSACELADASLIMSLPDGRRPIFMTSFPLMALGSLGVGLARSVPELMVWRIVQALGAAPGFSVGGAIIGDIYKLEERGSAMGLFFGVSLSAVSYSSSLHHSMTLGLPSRTCHCSAYRWSVCSLRILASNAVCALPFCSRDICLGRAVSA